MATKRGGPYVDFSTELNAPTFTDHHGNIAGSPEDLAKMTLSSNYVENQFQKQAGIPCGDCEQVNCICPEPGGTNNGFRMNKQFPGKKRITFCG